MWSETAAAVVVDSACPRIFPITCACLAAVPPLDSFPNQTAYAHVLSRRPHSKRNSWHPTCIASQTTYTPVRASPRQDELRSSFVVRFLADCLKAEYEETLDRANGELRALRGQERYASCANFPSLLPEKGTAPGLLSFSLRTFGSGVRTFRPLSTSSFGIAFSYSYIAIARCEP